MYINTLTPHWKPSNSVDGSKGVHAPHRPPSPAADMTNQCQTLLADPAMKLPVLSSPRMQGGCRHPQWSTQAMKPIGISLRIAMIAAVREMRREELSKVRGLLRTASW